jgi:hypothetical protein
MILRIDKAIRARTKTEDKMELRFRYRQRFLLPLVDRMRQWISEHISSPAVQTDELMLTAFNYIDRRWEEATCFIRNPRVLPHNNIPEQYFRFLKLGTKNWLFCASEWGAETLCTLYTLVYSAKMLNINPSVYLTDVIQQIDVPGVTADQLVPRVWKETREKIATERYFSKHSSSFSSAKETTYTTFHNRILDVDRKRYFELAATLTVLLASAISYFRNNKSKMPYARNVELNLPIGSGVTEAGVKVIIKQRLCQSGMRWKEEGAAVVIRLRTMVQTVGRWSQFWAKVSQFGFPIVS